MSIKKCSQCKNHEVSVNYIRNGKIYYRNLCYYCIKQNKKEKELPSQLLKKSRYKKKMICDRCGFTAKTTHQIDIYYADGNRFNVSLSNLKSICLNCYAELKHVPGTILRDIRPDY